MPTRQRLVIMERIKQMIPEPVATCSEMYELKIVCHGGGCCGIKTVKNFHYAPDEKNLFQPKLIKKSRLSDGSMSGTTMTVGKNWFTDDAPAESIRDRLIRYVDYTCHRRPDHYIEAILTPGQLKNWKECLEEIGFREMVTFKNSNSESKLFIYGLVISGGKVKKS